MNIREELKRVNKETQRKFFHGNVKAQMGNFVTQK